MDGNVTTTSDISGPECHNTAVYLAIGGGVLAVLSELLGTLPPERCPNGIVHGLQQLAGYLRRSPSGDARAQVAGLPL